MIPGNAGEYSGKCSRRFRKMFKKTAGNVQEDSGECYQRFWGMFKKIPGNVQENYEECFGPNPFNFKLIKTTFYLRKANAKLILGAWSIFAMSNETIGRSNKIIWYFHFFFFFLNSKWKEIARPWGKTKRRKIKNQNKQKEKKK